MTLFINWNRLFFLFFDESECQQYDMCDGKYDREEIK